MKNIFFNVILVFSLIINLLFDFNLENFIYKIKMNKL